MRQAITPLRSLRGAVSYASALVVVASAFAGCSGSGGSASVVAAGSTVASSPSPSPSASASASPSPSPQPSRAPSACTTNAAPVLSATERFVVAFDGGPGLDGAYVASFSWAPGTYGQQIFQSASPSGPFTKVQDNAFIGTGGGCMNSSDIGHLRPGASYYFELAGYVDATHVAPVSNVATVTIPPSSGDTGPLTVGGSNGSGGVTWPNPVQGYRTFNGSALSSDTGFSPDQELLGFQIGVAAGSTVCVSVQGYGSSGQLGPIEGPVCGKF